MPCFYCGKPISFVRRLADTDFCSEDHRQKYHELTRQALDRLVETRSHLEAATPRRRRQRAATAVGLPNPPLPTDLLPERTTAVPIAGQLRFGGECATEAHSPCLPGIQASLLVGSASARQWAPADVPGALPTSEAPPALGSAPGDFLPLTACSKPSWAHLTLGASLARPGLPAPSLRLTQELQAVKGDAGAPAGHEAYPVVCALSLRSFEFSPEAGATLANPAVFALQAPAAHAPPPGRLIARAQAEPPASLALLPSGTPFARPPSGPAPAHAGGFLLAAAPLLAPSPPPPVVGVPPADFAAAAPALPTPGLRSLRSVLETASEAPLPACLPSAGLASPAAPALGPAHPLPPLPQVSAPSYTLAVPGLSLGAAIPRAPAAPLERPPLAVLDPGYGILTASSDVRFRHSSIWRLEPVELDLTSLTVPAALPDWLPVSQPQPRAPDGQAVAAPAEPWRHAAASLLRTASRAGRMLLASARPVPLELPAEQAGAESRVARMAPSAEFPITRRSYIGWGAASLRRALSSAEPLALEMHEGRAGAPAVRESPSPGFRIAAWAFTHAPGLAGPTVTPEAALLAAGPPAPADSAPGRIRSVEAPPAPPAPPVLPRLRTGLVEEQLPHAAAEPPEASYVSLPAVRPCGGMAALPIEPAVELRAPEAGWPAGFPHHTLPVPWLRTCATACTPALPAPRAGTGDPHHRGALVFAALTRLPESRPQAPRLSASGLSSASLAFTPAVRGPAGPPPPLGWQTPHAPLASFLAIRPNLNPVGWAPAGHWPAAPPDTPAGGSGDLRPASVAMREMPLARPALIDAVAPGPFRGAQACPLAPLPPVDDAYTLSRRPDAAFALASPAIVTLPARTLGLPDGRLPAFPPAPTDGQARDVPKALRQPAPQPLTPASIALHAGPGIPACVSDLSWPYASPVEPPLRDQPSASRGHARLLPIGVSALLQARPLAPVPHRFERLPPEPKFVPSLRAARSWKRIPRRAVLAIAAPTLIVLLGFLLWNPAREALRRRAAVTVGDDFSAGMERWTGGAADWSRDPAGFALVGSLALLGPSLRMVDYRLEFQGQIERDSLAWVFRAADPENYYAMKVAVLKPGPLPTLALIRYRVAGGQQATPVQVPLRIMLHNESTFRVQMRVSGSDFTTFVNQQQVDFWTDDRFASGGIGFFCDKGSRARLYWVRITHQDDLVGKLCSYFAPYDFSRNGSWK